MKERNKTMISLNEKSTLFFDKSPQKATPINQKLTINLFPDSNTPDNNPLSASKIPGGFASKKSFEYIKSGDGTRKIDFKILFMKFICY